MDWQKYNPPVAAADLLAACPSVTIAGSVPELVDLACGGAHQDRFEVTFETNGAGKVVEAVVVRVRNGIAANYLEPYCGAATLTAW